MDKAEKRKVEKAAIEAVLQEGIDFYVTVNKPNILHRFRLLKKERHYNIKPLVLGTLLKVSRIMLDMNLPEKVSKENWMTAGVEAMATQTELLLDIISLAIHNKDGKPNKRLKRVLRKNATPTELLALLSYVIAQMDVSDFMKSIISVKGMSLISEGSQIARPKESETKASGA